jgi:MFS family permease
VEDAARLEEEIKPRIFYGWYIVAVGFLSNIASSFALASTLALFLKPLTADLGVSRGVFSLLRSGEGIIGACLAPLIGTLVDRHGGARLMAVGTTLVGIGYLFLGHIDSFGQFVFIRLALVTVGDALMGASVVNIVIARWFVRQRGRALAISSMGVGFAKVCMPIVGAWLILMFGWRHTWTLFGLGAVVLGVAPALLVVRKSPEEMGLNPDGDSMVTERPNRVVAAQAAPRRKTVSDDVRWTPREALRTSAFWLLAITFGIASIGVTGLNLHIYSYVTDVGYSAVVAASVMSVIASMQLASPLAWGFLTERIDARYAAMLRFVVQGLGLGLAVIMSGNLLCVYIGFFLYGIGLGGNMVLPDILWADYFGRLSLGQIRGMGILISQVLAAIGPPFFGFLFDITGGYGLSFTIFGIVLMISAILSLMLRRPQKHWSDGVLE